MKKNIDKITIQPLPHFSNRGVLADILRLDLLHPVVSGNKWFKLQYYLADALDSGQATVATFGGAYSNHIVATAYAANEMGLKSMGYIRGEIPEKYNSTLSQAMDYGMELQFIERNAYRDKATIMQKEKLPGVYCIMEGGYGKTGAKGAGDIMAIADTQPYTDIVCAVGTGTMMAGLVQRAAPHQKITGISVLKNHLALKNEVKALLDEADKEKNFTILHDYHFGGYAKHPAELIAFMNTLWLTERLPTDMVYTAKLLFAVQDLINKDYFPAGSRLLLIHSGGLQGNNSLPAGSLLF